jgi:O-antigen/teichoic acid export membrane protein
MQVRKSLWITLAVSNGQTVIYFFASLVMARLLTPSDIGAFSIAVVVINIASIFRDLGCNPYLVRRENLTPADVSSVLGLTLSTAAVLSLLIWLGRHEVAAYYHDPRIANVLQVLAFNFLLVPPNAALAAVLARRLDAVSGAKIGLMATLTHLIISLSLAYAGYGPMAPAWATTGSLLVTLAMNRLLVERVYVLRPSFRGWPEILSFSRGVLVNNSINMATASMPDLFIGRRLGPAEVGLFSRATGVTGLLQVAIGPALGFNTLPVLANAFREGESALRYVLTRSTALLTGVSWPFYVWLGIFAEPVIRLLYGPTWVATAALVPWLCFAAAAKAPFSMLGPALQAINQPMSGAWASLPTLLLRLAFLAVVPADSVVWVVAALCLADVLALFTWVRVAHRVLGLSIWAFAKSQVESAVVALTGLCAGLALQFADKALELHLLVLVPLSLAVVGGAAAWMVFRIDHPFAQELQRARRSVVSMIRDRSGRSL